MIFVTHIRYEFVYEVFVSILLATITLSMVVVTIVGVASGERMVMVVLVDDALNDFSKSNDVVKSRGIVLVEGSVLLAELV